MESSTATPGLQRIREHVSLALDHIRQAQDVEKGLKLDTSGLYKVLAQAARTSLRALDDVEMFIRFPRQVDGDEG